jgi:YHS domain-containing protein
MFNLPFRRAALMLTLTLVVPVAGTPVLADQPAWYFSSQTLALSGYDAVAYFTESKAVPGKAEFEHAWNGARWRFASAANRDRFAAAPQTYAPQFGGYCAWAVSRGYTASGDPNAWSVVAGKLYLNYSMKVRAQWEQDVPGNIAKGVANWPSVLSK